MGFELSRSMMSAFFGEFVSNAILPELAGGKSVSRGFWNHKQKIAMPELARFYGIIICMFMEPLTPHNRLHFQAYYQESVAVVGVDEVEWLAGELPRRQLRLVLAWANFTRKKLFSAWALLQSGPRPFEIKPLT